MKKIIKILALIVAVCLSFTACNQGTSNLEQISIFSRPTVEKVTGQKKNWLDVDSFICYYSDFVEEQKNFDVSIMHSNTLFSSANSKEQVKELSDNGTYVIAYITVGEDDSLNTGDGLGENGYASYYIYENGAPKMNGNWNSYFVDAGNPVWQAKIIDRARQIISYGVDGLFLDTLDTVDIAPETLGGMVSLVKLLKSTFPDIKLIANRGFNVLQYISQYIDGLMFESFNTTYNFELGMVVDLDPAAVAYNEYTACNIINAVRRYDYFPVFALDYVNELEFNYMPQAYYDRSWQYDFIPYTSYDIQLATPCNPGIKPNSKRGELALSNLGASSLGENNADTTINNFAFKDNGTVISVDSTYGGYSKNALNDGWFSTAENHNQENWAQESWASSDNKNQEHFIEFEFTEAKSVGKVYVHWANDNGKFYSPRQCVVQAFVNNEWVEVGSWSNVPADADADYLANIPTSEIKFTNITTKKIRVVQPKGQGAADKFNNELRPGLMWVSEVEIFA